MKLLSLWLILIVACNSTTLNKKNNFINYNFNEPLQVHLDSKLNEISDLESAGDGNVFALNDELGVIYKINPFSGEIIKGFSLGRWTVEADFEGLTKTNEYLFALTSEGVLYKFKEGQGETSVNYEVISLPFSSKFDLEGLYYDSDLNGLLIVPKDYSGKNLKDYRAVYFYSLKEEDISRDPMIKISLKDLKKNHDVKDFYPSAISKHPVSGNYFILSAKDQNVLVEIDPSGKILAVQKLNEKVHRQPEGITFLPDNSILISDEAAGKKPTLTLYKFNK